MVIIGKHAMPNLEFRIVPAGDNVQDVFDGGRNLKN